jgi:uncharacterized membrane protein YdbT with pleckstrin-like domain
MELSTGEHVLFEGHPSWRSTLTFYIKGLLVVAVAAAVAAAVTAVGDEFSGGITSGAALAALALVLVAGYLRRMSTTYTISNRRLHIKRGIISRRTQEARLERVQNVNTDQSALERILKVGTVDFDTAGGDDHDFKFAGVADPSEVVQAVDAAQREAATEPGPGV